MSLFPSDESMLKVFMDRCRTLEAENAALHERISELEEDNRDLKEIIQNTDAVNWFG